MNKNKCIAKIWETHLKKKVKKGLAKIWETHLKKKVRKGPPSLLKISLWGSSVSACAKKSPGFSVSGASTPNGLFQTINGLKRLLSRLLQTAPLTILNFLLTIKVSYFLFFTYVKNLRSTMTRKENLPYINKFFSSSFSSTSPAIRMYFSKVGTCVATTWQ